jgi:hypothetical protein
MSEDFANHLQFDATCEHQARRRMAKFMRMPVIQSSMLADYCEISIEVSRIDWRTKIRRKDEASVSPEFVPDNSLLLLSLSVLQKQTHQTPREVHRPSTPRRLRVGSHESSAFTL